MGSDPLYFTATAVFRMLHPPYLIGGLSMLVGIFDSMLRGRPQLDDAPLRKFIRA